MSWLPAPRYLMRRNVVKRILKQLPPGQRFIEIGAATGDTVELALACGFSSGVAVETSPQAISILETKFKDDGRVRIVTNYETLPDQCCDVLMAFEVLEHLEDDVAALTHFFRLIASGSLLLASVPARMAGWGDSDVWAGHVRRYEREELYQKLSKVGFESVQVFAYGYPLTILLDRWRHWSANRLSSSISDQSAFERTLLSGVDRKRIPAWFRLFANDLVFAPAYGIQRLFPHARGATALMLTARRSK